MSRLDDYRTALLAAHPDVPSGELGAALEAKAPFFPGFIIDYGLGPLWHERTGHDVFYESRMRAEALFAMQEQALVDVDDALTIAGIDYVVIKGAANRLLLYENPAVRACFDLDLLVRPGDRITAAKSLINRGFIAYPDESSISRELVLSRAGVDVDLHWGLLREGRLRTDPTERMLERRREERSVWMLADDDALFTQLVHPAFAKHLSGWDMGLHRVADLLALIHRHEFDWAAVCAMLRANGVLTAAWATLRWTQLLAGENAPPTLQQMLGDLQPGQVKRKWIDFWLRNDLPGRTSANRWMRLLGFSSFLHDSPGDVLRAARGRRQAHLRSDADTDAFRGLVGE